MLLQFSALLDLQLHYELKFEDDGIIVVLLVLDRSAIRRVAKH